MLSGPQILDAMLATLKALPFMTGADHRHATTVLVIDDDTWIRSLLSDLLRAEGYSVQAATNGAAGVRLAKEHLPEVVVLDLAMPEMSGADVLRELKSDKSTMDIPVIIVSAYTNDLQAEHAGHVAAIIQKPFDITALIAEVERAASTDR